MTTILILFFVSLTGITVMIGRKLTLVKNGRIAESHHPHPFIPDFNKIKHLIFENTKKYGHLSLVTILRFYIRSSYFFKKKYEEIKIKIKNISTPKDLNGNGTKKTEVSKFLKMISDYKHKIREIKQKIHEEENHS